MYELVFCRWCYCDKDEGESMIQCSSCEDWFHENCVRSLSSDLPSDLRLFEDNLIEKNDTSALFVCSFCKKGTVNHIDGTTGQSMGSSDTISPSVDSGGVAASHVPPNMEDCCKQNIQDHPKRPYEGAQSGKIKKQCDHTDMITKGSESSDEDEDGDEYVLSIIESIVICEEYPLYE